MGDVSRKKFLCANMVTVNAEGYLVNASQWTQEWAEQVAAQKKIQLTQAHWIIIKELRAFYQEYELVPSMRVWMKLIRQHLSEEQASTLYVTQLFSSHPLKIAAMISGLPKPKQCL